MFNLLLPSCCCTKLSKIDEKNANDGLLGEDEADDGEVHGDEICEGEVDVDCEVGVDGEVGSDAEVGAEVDGIFSNDASEVSEFEGEVKDSSSDLVTDRLFFFFNSGHNSKKLLISLSISTQNLSKAGRLL